MPLLGAQPRAGGLVVDVPGLPASGSIVVPEIYAEIDRRLEREEYAHPSGVILGPLVGRNARFRQNQVGSAGAIAGNVERDPAPAEVFDRIAVWWNLLEHATTAAGATREAELDDAVKLLSGLRPETSATRRRRDQLVDRARGRAKVEMPANASSVVDWCALSD
jgi:hypothetical protein